MIAFWQCYSCRQVSEISFDPCPNCGGMEGSFTKRCTGETHPPGGAQVSLTEFSLMEGGGRVKRPVSRCKRCRSVSRKTTIPLETYHPMIMWLKGRGMTQTDIAKAIGVDDDIVSQWVHKRTKSMRRKFFFKLLSLRSEVAKGRLYYNLYCNRGHLKAENYVKDSRGRNKCVACARIRSERKRQKKLLQQNTNA